VNDLLDGRWFGEPIEPLKPEQIGILYRVTNPLIRTLRDELQKKVRLPCDLAH